MSRSFREKNPSNARVFIDYKNKDNPVRFEYPAKKSPFKIAFKSFFAFWMMLLGFFLILIITPIIIILLVTTSPTNTIGSVSDIIDSLSLTMLFLCYTPVIPLIFAYLFVTNKRLLSLLPRINCFISTFPFGSYYYKYIMKINSKVFELPSFSNVFINYKADGDFSKLLERVEIVEHDFKISRKKLFGKNSKEEQQDDLWKARFYFKEIPRDGWLKIWFV